MNLTTLDAQQHRLAVSAGEAWACALSADLRGQRRAIVGGWPGTLREARAWVVAAIDARGGKVVLEDLPAMSRTAYNAARAHWLSVSSRDVDD
jgi:hypothetical protein